MKKQIQERYKVLLEAVEREKEAEEEYYKNLAASKSLKEKIEAGLAWSPISLLDQKYSIGERIVLDFERLKHLNKPHKFKSGMGCVLRLVNDETQTLTGRISFVRKNKVSILLNAQYLTTEQSLDIQKSWTLESVFDERPYKVMKDAIFQLLKSTDPQLVELRDKVALAQDFNDRTLETGYNNSNLNESQNIATANAIGCEYMSVIHGPPGTGKTTTLIEVLKSIVKTEKKVLVCGPSNNAVDLLAIKAYEAGLKTLRIGNVTRISGQLSHLTLHEQARAHPDWQHIKKVRIEANAAQNEAQKHKRNFGAKERQDRKSFYNEARELRKWAKDLESRLMDHLVEEAQVICTTLISASHTSIQGLRFQTVLIDEAAQALEPECWNAILKARRVILAGDHLQLAPTVKSRQAMELGLDKTLLDRMTGVISNSHLLNIQYRMNDAILSFSNQEFYSGNLKSDESVANWRIADKEAPLVIIDTSGCGFEEDFNPKTKSRFNEGELFILREHFLQKQEQFAGASIGIISPYAEQVKFIRSKIENDPTFASSSLSVDSIDGFQGQERDVIYLSLVRSNSDGEIGFLKDERRLNVAMTRAKKKLIILGDFSTLSQYPLFDRLAQHVEQRGFYRSAWEFMSV